MEIQSHHKNSLRLEEIGCCTRTEENEIKHQQCYHKVLLIDRFMIGYNTFNNLLHLSRSEYLLQSIHNGQRNYLYEMSTSAMLIFSKCIYLINVSKCKFDPNETITMYDLSSSNLLSLVYSRVYNLFLLTATLVKSCKYPQVKNFDEFWFNVRSTYTHVLAVISAYFESKLPRSKTSKLTRIQNIRILMNYQTVRLVSTFGSGSCVSSFGSSPKVETAAVSSFGLNPKVETADAFPVLGLHNQRHLTLTSSIR